MIYKELSKIHFTNVNAKKILITNAKLSDTFYDEIYAFKSKTDLAKHLNNKYSDWYLYIDINRLTLKEILNVLLVIREETIRKVFLVHTPPNLAIAQQPCMNDFSIYKSNNFGTSKTTTVLINAYSENVKSCLKGLNSQHLNLYVPFPSYFPYDKEYLTIQTLKDIDLTRTTANINYFDSTNPYDIFYKLIEAHSLNDNLFVCCDSLILSSVVCYLEKYKCDNYLLSAKVCRPSNTNDDTYYEISDLL